MKQRLAELETIIFDLGEVVVDLDTKAVLEQFAKLTNAAGSRLKELLMSTPFLYEYETGQIDKYAFANEMGKAMGVEIQFDDFEYAWNLMVKDITVKRLEFIQQLKKTHQVLILSNTNDMHEDKFELIMQERIGMKMTELAHKAYYSHRIGYRKPNLDIYEFIIEENNLNPQKSLFLDDRKDNILAAKEVGLQAQQVMFPDQIFEILSYE